MWLSLTFSNQCNVAKQYVLSWNEDSLWVGDSLVVDVNTSLLDDPMCINYMGQEEA